MKLAGDVFSLARRLKGTLTGPSSFWKGDCQAKALDLLPETPRRRAEARGRKLQGGKFWYQKA